MPVTVRNESSYPTKTVEKLVRSTMADLDVVSAAVRVIVRHSTHRYTTGHWEFLGGSFGAAEIVIRLPKRGVQIGGYHPYERKREQGKAFPLADWKEALVAVAAHEAEHHRQRWVLGERAGRRERRGRDGRVLRAGSGHRRVDVEIRCDLAALRAWRRYREARNLPTDIAS